MPRGRLGHEGCAVVLVARKTAGREDEAHPGANAPLSAGLDNHRARHAPALDNDVLDRTLETNRHALFQETSKEPRRERVSHDQARSAWIAEAVDQIARHEV